MGFTWHALDPGVWTTFTTKGVNLFYILPKATTGCRGHHLRIFFLIFLSCFQIGILYLVFVQAPRFKHLQTHFIQRSCLIMHTISFIFFHQTTWVPFSSVAFMFFCCCKLNIYEAEIFFIIIAGVHPSRGGFRDQMGCRGACRLF